VDVQWTGLRQRLIADLIVECALVFTAVLWDFGGVILSSPFDAFDRYERERGLPAGFIRSVNAADPDTNAWARLERNEVTAAEFDDAFAAESERLGHRVPGNEILAMLYGDVRPAMVATLDRVNAAGYRTACLTNNVLAGNVLAGNVLDGDVVDAGRSRPDVDAVMKRFDVVVESSKVGVRKPEVRFYEIACDLLGVTPDQCVFLDDLGINLKPARAMGMTTIKVGDPEQAIAELETLLDL